MSGTREWDAGTYDRVSAPQLGWGRAVLSRLSLRGDEVVIDAGCGSGRVTELLLDALPGGRVIGVDGSRAMLERAGRRLAAAGGRHELVHGDLLEVELPAEADAVFSSATFHWITDHEALFGRIGSWLRPGGRLEAQCGGRGNIASFLEIVAAVGSRDPYSQHLSGLASPTLFAEPEETEERLAAAGFGEVDCSLDPAPEAPPDPRAYAEAVCLGPALAVLPRDLASAFVDEVMAAWGPDPTLDYVRLNISARKPQKGPAD